MTVNRCLIFFYLIGALKKKKKKSNWGYWLEGIVWDYSSSRFSLTKSVNWEFSDSVESVDSECAVLIGS